MHSVIRKVLWPLSASLLLVASATAMQGSRTIAKIRTLTAEQEEILSHMSIVYLNDGQGGTVKTLRIGGINVQIVNDSGTTDGAPDGLGNLIVGYNELRGAGDDRTGSHNLVTGRRNNYTSFGGLIVGMQNEISGRWSSVSGGLSNTAIGEYSSVSGGNSNTASVISSSVSGGIFNTTDGYYSSISGGIGNTTTGLFSSISGGGTNIASGTSVSISGGRYNAASGYASSVSGGLKNTTSGSFSSVSGGSYNTASGYASSVSGGAYRSSAGSEDWVAGTLFEDN